MCISQADGTFDMQHKVIRILIIIVCGRKGINKKVRI